MLYLDRSRKGMKQWVLWRDLEVEMERLQKKLKSKIAGNFGKKKIEQCYANIFILCITTYIPHI